MIDAKAFGLELAEIIRAAQAPLLARIEQLEKAAAERPAPVNGKDADPVKVAALVHDQITGDLRRIEDKLDALEAAFEGLPEVPERPELPDIDAMVAKAVAHAVAALPPPQKGERGERGERGEKGADGVGLAGAFIDRDGGLVVTLTDGAAKSLGPVVGKDGAAGRDGADGKDGLGFEDLELTQDDQGRAVARFVRGEIVKEVRLPGIIYRGPHRAGETYLKGDAVSHGGSMWIAQADTAEKPEASADWRLAVKRGRDGRDGEVKTPAPGPDPVRLR